MVAHEIILILVFTVCLNEDFDGSSKYQFNDLVNTTYTTILFYSITKEIINNVVLMDNGHGL